MLNFSTTQAFSCFSATHSAMSRTDFIVVPNTLLPLMEEQGVGSLDDAEWDEVLEGTKLV